MPNNNNFAYGLANLLSGAARGYFRRKSLQEQDKAKAEREYWEDIAKTNREFLLDEYKVNPSDELAKALGIPDNIHLAHKRFIQEQSALKANTGEKKPSIGESTTGLFRAMNTPTGERKVTTQAPVYGGNVRGGFEKVGTVPIGETTYDITPDDKTRMVTQKLAELESIPGVELPKELQDKVLKSVGIEPPERQYKDTNQVTETQLYLTQKKGIVDPINNIQQEIEAIRRQKITKPYQRMRPEEEVHLKELVEEKKKWYNLLKEYNELVRLRGGKVPSQEQYDKLKQKYFPEQKAAEVDPSQMSNEELFKMLK